MGETTVLYGGLDLHGDNVFCTLMDAARNVRFERRFPNDLFTITEGLKPFRKWIKALAVESTYNWYWLVDGLRKVKYDVRLANPARMQENIGLKAANDKTDARFIARQLVNGILPRATSTRRRRGASGTCCGGKRVIAVKAPANKLAKACCFMMRDGTVSAGRKPADETTADSEHAFVPAPTVNGVKT